MFAGKLAALCKTTNAQSQYGQNHNAGERGDDKKWIVAHGTPPDG
jgi:hypothetical protein